MNSMINDVTINDILAYTPLSFTQRRCYSRSNITIDFKNNTVTTDDIEPADNNDPFSAVLFFQGQQHESVKVDIVDTIPDQCDIFPAPAGQLFVVDEWYCIQNDITSIPGATASRKLQRLVQIIEVSDNNTVKINYKNGWDILAGDRITWTKVLPVSNVTIKNLYFVGKSKPEYISDPNDTTWGSNPIAFEFAVNTHVKNINATNTFWPTIMRRWNTLFTTEQCQLINAAATEYGGAGYLTQQIYCLYGLVRNCKTSNARHLNDFTASAYCTVESCHADNEYQTGVGGFVTHGQFEHDLFYSGNSGIMTFANSGIIWGSSAKRMNVIKHICPLFFARANITDLVLDDVKVVINKNLDASLSSYQGVMWLNADGVKINNCSADGGLIISKNSNLSQKQNILMNSDFKFIKESTSSITNSYMDDSKSFLIFFGCSFSSENGTYDIFCSYTNMLFDKCYVNKISFNYSAMSGRQYIKFDNAMLVGDNKNALISITDKEKKNAFINFNACNINNYSHLLYSPYSKNNISVTNSDVFSCDMDSSVSLEGDLGYCICTQNRGYFSTFPSPVKTESVIIENNLILESEVVTNLTVSYPPYCYLQGVDFISYRCSTLITLTNENGTPVPNTLVNLTVAGGQYSIISDNPILSDGDGKVLIQTAATQRNGVPTGTLTVNVGGYISKDIELPYFPS